MHMHDHSNKLYFTMRSKYGIAAHAKYHATSRAGAGVSPPFQEEIAAHQTSLPQTLGSLALFLSPGLQHGHCDPAKAGIQGVV